MADAADGTVGDGLGTDNGPAAVAAPDRVELRTRIAEFHDEYSAELRRFILGVTRDPDRVDDVTQATLAKALELGHTARPGTFKGWLFRVAFHEALAVRRREKAGDNAARRLAGRGCSRVPDPGPDAVALRGEVAGAVRRALEGLPPDQRKVVVARVYDEKPFAEIAREAGLPLGTVLTRMRLALDKLRVALRTEN